MWLDDEISSSKTCKALYEKTFCKRGFRKCGDRGHPSRSEGCMGVVDPWYFCWGSSPLGLCWRVVFDVGGAVLSNVLPVYLAYVCGREQKI
jgi:hypothetical protein